MSRWVCPQCEREFDLPRQAHTCVPGGTVDQTFAARPQFRGVYEAIVDHLRTLGPLHEDAVGVGVFLKHQAKLAEVRPMARALSLELVLPTPVASPRVARCERLSATRFVHVIRVSSVDDVDDELRRLLTTAYVAAG